MPAPILVLYAKAVNPQHFSFQSDVTKKYKEAFDEVQHFFQFYSLLSDP